MAKTSRKQPSNWIIGGVLLVILAVLWLGWDIWNRRQRPFDCGDGPRYTIDTRQFATQYSAYSLKLEATLRDKTKLSAELAPVQQEKLSEAMQSADEFRKYLVSGFNSCAITKADYGKFGARFQALDDLARQIDTLTAKDNLSDEERAKLAALIDQYGDAAHRLGTE